MIGETLHEHGRIDILVIVIHVGFNSYVITV